MNERVVAYLRGVERRARRARLEVADLDPPAAARRQQQAAVRRHRERDRAVRAVAVLDAARDRRAPDDRRALPQREPARSCLSVASARVGSVATSACARAAGVNRTYFHRLISRHNVR